MGLNCDRCGKDADQLVDIRGERSSEISWPVHWCRKCVEEVGSIEVTGEKDVEGEKKHSFPSYEVVDEEELRNEVKDTLDRDTSAEDVRLHGMRAEVLSDCKTGMENNYDFCCITVHSEPTEGEGKRLATYVDYGDLSDREARLFIERSPPGMGWLEKVFELLRETEALPLIAGGIKEVKTVEEGEIEIRETDGIVEVVDKSESKVYHNREVGGSIGSLSP